MPNILQILLSLSLSACIRCIFSQAFGKIKQTSPNKRTVNIERTEALGGRKRTKRQEGERDKEPNPFSLSKGKLIIHRVERTKSELNLGQLFPRQHRSEIHQLECMDGKSVSPWICRKNHFNYQSVIKKVEKAGKEGIFAPINSLLDGNEARKRK